MLRIVGGTLSGRRFAGPVSDATRPTSERVREALASSLEARDLIAGAEVWDLYAGSGALAFEALSRGAERALLVEQDARTAKSIEQSAAQLGLADRTRVVRASLGRPKALTRLSTHSRRPATLVFADPPYAEIDAACRVLEGALAGGLLAPRVRIVLEHAHKAPPALASGFRELASYRYGDTAVQLWGRADEEL